MLLDQLITKYIDGSATTRTEIANAKLYDEVNFKQDIHQKHATKLINTPGKHELHLLRMNLQNT